MVFLSGIRFLLLVINNVSVFTCILLQNELIGCELLLFYHIQVSHNIFFEIHNLLLRINHPREKNVVRGILKYASDMSKVLRLEVPVNIKALSINQYCSTTICNVIPWVTIGIYALKMVNSLLQIIL